MYHKTRLIVYVLDLYIKPVAPKFYFLLYFNLIGSVLYVCGFVCWEIKILQQTVILSSNDYWIFRRQCIKGNVGKYLSAIQSER